MKLRLFYLFALITPMLSWAQDCTIDSSFTEPGFYPDTIATPQMGVAFHDELKFLNITDTTFSFNGTEVEAVLDTMIIDSVVGLPEGFTIECSKPNCIYEGGDFGCIAMNSNQIIDSSMIGHYPLLIYFTNIGRLPTINNIRIEQVDTLKDFHIFIGVERWALSINKHFPEHTIDWFPNPSNGIFYTDFTFNEGENYRHEVYSYDGKRIRTFSNVSFVNLNDLETGIYFIKTTADHYSSYKRVVLE